MARGLLLPLSLPVRQAIWPNGLKSMNDPTSIGQKLTDEGVITSANDNYDAVRNNK